jgi:hypothetical protein
VFERNERVDHLLGAALRGVPHYRPIARNPSPLRAISDTLNQI